MVCLIFLTPRRGDGLVERQKRRLQIRCNTLIKGGLFASRLMTNASVISSFLGSFLRTASAFGTSTPQQK